jgi:lactoylglutathione lyase
MISGSTFDSAIPDQTKLFHIGHYVADLEAAMAEMTAKAGLSWATIERMPIEAWLNGSGFSALDLEWTYSIEGPIHIELCRFPAGTIWDATDLVNVHHLGYWCEDIAAASDALIARGWEIAFAGNRPDERQERFCMLRSPKGDYHMELVSAGGKDRFKRWLTGGSLTDPM